MGSKRLTPTRVGKMASECLLLLLLLSCCRTKIYEDAIRLFSPLNKSNALYSHAM